MKRIVASVLALGLVASLCACGGEKTNSQEPEFDRPIEEVLGERFASDSGTYDPSVPVAGDPILPEEEDPTEEVDGLLTIEENDAPLAASALLLPQASGTRQESNSEAIIDYSNVSDGYVMVAYRTQTSIKIKSQVTCPDGVVYTYNLVPGYWIAFPLTHGDGNYKVTILRNANGNKYATVLSTTVAVALSDTFAPYIRPSQYVDYVNATNTVAKASELMEGCSTTLQKVNAVYDWVVANIKYDKQQAATVQSGYLPVLDNVLARKQGICFDYAALMCGMLRSQLIPCKLVVGYAGTAYHAWISVYTTETGWIDNAIYFDGVDWHRMDPTFASTGNNDAQVLQYIGNGKNYTECFTY